MYIYDEHFPPVYQNDCIPGNAILLHETNMSIFINFRLGVCHFHADDCLCLNECGCQTRFYTEKIFETRYPGYMVAPSIGHTPNVYIVSHFKGIAFLRSNN